MPATPDKVRRARAALFAAAPVVLLFLGAAVFHGLQAASRKTLPHAAGSAPADLAALNAARQNADEDEARDAAQKLVRTHLLRGAAAVRFSRQMVVEKRTPTLFRVRAEIAEIQDGSGKARSPRRFEADLRHGPADDKWYLVDTEFLDEDIR